MALECGKVVLARNKEVIRKTNIQVLLAALKTCSRVRNLERGKEVHAEAVESGHDSNLHVATGLINMYSKCGSMVEARKVFDGLNHSDVVCWTSLILGYAVNGQGHIALDLFTRMNSEGPAPNSVTFVAALKACTILAGKGVIQWAECSDWGKKIHNFSVQKRCNSDPYMQSTLVDLYAKCGNMRDAREVFDGMKDPDVVSWNVVILGYADNGRGCTALDLFTRMRAEGPIPDLVTYVAALKACTSLAVIEGASSWAECWARGKGIHNFAVEDGCNSYINVQNTLLDLYAKCGFLMDAGQVFDGINRPDVVSWNVLILGYADNGHSDFALRLFTRMRIEGPAPNSVTFVAALKVCGLVGALEFGRTLHLEINSGIEVDIVLVTCLVDFYAKCGSLGEALSVFNLHLKKRDVITWNALMAGFSSCGDNQAVFGLFETMQDTGFRPNGVTFLSILTCCSHAGLVEKGKECFDTMSTKYGIVPIVDHYNCMIDMFGRANRLDDAMDLLERMSCSPDDVTWMTILAASRKWKNVEIGRLAFKALIDLNDSDAAAYVLMEQIYGSRGMFHEQDEVAGSKKRLIQASKKAGESCWTTEAGEVHKFFEGDNQHPQICEIHNKWKSLVVVMRQHGFPDNLLSEKEQGLCGHSERLALLCAVINTEYGKTIRIVKNQRVCYDCHAATAIISKLECRTIICRDASRIHVFKNGKCSCDDQ